MRPQSSPSTSARAALGRFSRSFAALTLLAATALAGCSSGTSAEASGSGGAHAGTTGSGGAGGNGSGGAVIPPAPVVNEQKSPSAVYVDAPYQAEMPSQFRTTETLADLDVRAIAITSSGVSVGTPSGLFRLNANGAGFDPVTIPGSGAVVDMATFPDGSFVVARPGGVVVLDGKGTPGAFWPVPSATVTAVATGGGKVYVGTDHGLGTIDGSGFSIILSQQVFAVRDLAVSGGAVWIATTSGVLRYDIASTVLLPALKAPTFLPDDDARALAAAPNGDVLVATATGLARIGPDGTTAKLTLPGPGALPNGDLRAVVADATTVFTGHGIGATATSAAGVDHYHSLRWIPAEAVSAVALAADGTRWIGTAAGVTRIAYAPFSLDQKALAFESTMPTFRRMGGFVADQADYADAWDHAASPQLSDRDNDGLWTEMNIVGWCYAYKATGDEAYYEAARTAMDTMFLLTDVPGETFAAKGRSRGFVARSLVRDDEGAVYSSKATQTNWHQQAFQGHTYYWKDDTSSDEYDGHFFGIPVFYDLCAKTEAERAAIRTRMHDVMSYIVDNGYKVIDLGGKPTTFAHWDNEATAVDGIGPCLGAGLENCAASFGGEGWLNATEILGHLLAAWHITGEARFYQEYERLAITERYGEMVPVKDTTITVTSHKNRNHSDHELASLAYYTLLRYEPNPERRAKWVAALQGFYGDEKAERNTLEIAVMASAMPGGYALPDAVETLKEWPLDQRGFRVDNAHRKDAKLDLAPDRFGNAQFESVFPYDEIAFGEWNGNPYAVADGGDGKSVQAPWPYLMPYWMLRYHGAITQK